MSLHPFSYRPNCALPLQSRLQRTSSELSPPSAHNPLRSEAPLTKVSEPTAAPLCSLHHLLSPCSASCARVVLPSPSAWPKLPRWPWRLRTPSRRSSRSQAAPHAHSPGGSRVRVFAHSPLFGHYTAPRQGDSLRGHSRPAIVEPLETGLMSEPQQELKDQVKE